MSVLSPTTHPDDVEQKIAGTTSRSAAAAAPVTGRRAEAEVQEPLVAILVVAGVDIVQRREISRVGLVGHGARGGLVGELDAHLVVLGLGLALGLGFAHHLVRLACLRVHVLQDSGKDRGRLV